MWRSKWFYSPAKNEARQLPRSLTKSSDWMNGSTKSTLSLVMECTT